MEQIFIKSFQKMFRIKPVIYNKLKKYFIEKLFKKIKLISYQI